MRYIVITLLISNLSFAGNEGGHGGDKYGLEFSELAYEIIKVLNQPKYVELIQSTHLDLSLFKQKVDNLIIDSAEGDKVHLCRTQGDSSEKCFEKDLINSENNSSMLLNRTRWRGSYLDEKLKLVLHEYFGLLDIEHDTYEVSYQYKRVLEELYFKILADPLNTVRYYGFEVTSAPLKVRGSLCKDNQPYVQEAVGKASKKAIDFCEAEQNRSCSVNYIEITEEPNKQFPGLVFCKVNTVAKPN